MSYTWDFSPIWRNAAFLLEGLLNTVWLSACAIALGLALGLVLAFFRLARSRILAIAAKAVIEFYRNTPPLVHFFWYFYGLPILIGVSLSPFVAALLALSIQSGAFFAEVFRGGIISVETGQWEAGRALGMSRSKTHAPDHSPAGPSTHDPASDGARLRARENNGASGDAGL